MCSKKISVTIEIDDDRFTMELLIVKDDLIPEEVFLGRDTLCREGKRLVIEGNSCWMLQSNDFKTGENLFDNDNNKIRVLVNKHRRCFATTTEELGECSVSKMEIQLTIDVPVAIKAYRIAFAKRPAVKKIVDELLMAKIISPSTSPYASPIVLVDKPNGEHRMCVDYRQLNAITVKRPCPMPIMEEQFAQLAGYHQIAR